jgi:beta-phosphoglucomutase family hydrolase
LGFRAGRLGNNAEVLGLPDQITALLFDMDGVLTQTAKLHADAWKQAFDEFLKSRAQSDGEEFVPFDKVKDYDEYVDGMPREDGVRSFLKSRDIELPGVGNKKNEILLRLIHDQGVEPYDGSVSYVKAAREQGLPCAVVSSSANTHDVLKAAGIADLFDTVVDGLVIQHDHLKGKPAPDSFLAGAKALMVEPANAVVFEDALSGVQAGHAGSFGYVVGVDRVGQRDELLKHGADVVVDDLAELLDA